MRLDNGKWGLATRSEPSHVGNLMLNPEIEPPPTEQPLRRWRASSFGRTHAYTAPSVGAEAASVSARAALGETCLGPSAGQLTLMLEDERQLGDVRGSLARRRCMGLQRRPFAQRVKVPRSVRRVVAPGSQRRSLRHSDPFRLRACKILGLSGGPCAGHRTRIRHGLTTSSVGELLKHAPDTWDVRLSGELGLARSSNLTDRPARRCRLGPAALAYGANALKMRRHGSPMRYTPPRSAGRIASATPIPRRFAGVSASP